MSDEDFASYIEDRVASFEAADRPELLRRLAELAFEWQDEADELEDAQGLEAGDEDELEIDAIDDEDLGG